MGGDRHRDTAHLSPGTPGQGHSLEGRFVSDRLRITVMGSCVKQSDVQQLWLQPRGSCVNRVYTHTANLCLIRHPREKRFTTVSAQKACSRVPPPGDLRHTRPNRGHAIKMMEMADTEAARMAYSPLPSQPLIGLDIVANHNVWHILKQPAINCPRLSLIRAAKTTWTADGEYDISTGLNLIMKCMTIMWLAVFMHDSSRFREHHIEAALIPQ